MANPSDLDRYDLPAVQVDALLAALLAELGRHSAVGRLDVTVLCGQTLLSRELEASLTAANWEVEPGVASLSKLKRQAETHDLLYITAHGLRGGAGLMLENADGDCDHVSIERTSRWRRCRRTRRGTCQLGYGAS